MFEKNRTLITILFTAITLILIIICGQTTRSVYYVPFILGCLASALLSSSLGGEFGIGAGSEFIYPDPTGLRTGKGILSIWLVVIVSLFLIANFVDNTVIGRLSIGNTKIFYPILILLMIFGIFGFKRK